MLPQIIQGGMGVYVSTPFLANTVSRLGGLGTVSGVVADKIMARVLQTGDFDGHYRRALSHFPFPQLAQLVLDEYFVAGGIASEAPYKPVPLITLEPSRLAIALHLCANFAFVWLAKEGHTNAVSINYLEKMSLVHLYAIYGAMLAGVDVLTMGAGIPLQVPAVLDAYARGEPAEYRVPITGLNSGTVTMRFDPRAFVDEELPALKRPQFLPIISSDVLATLMLKRLEKTPDPIQGFVVEGYTAGGHNAPPRGKPITYNSDGEPEYGERDEPDFGNLCDLGLPFWVAGSYASPEGLAHAVSLGARGIQVGSIFALCDESGMRPSLRQSVIRMWHRGELRIRKNATASPTGFPFMEAVLPGTLSDGAVYSMRRRVCSQHALSTLHRMPDGSIVYRCPAERVVDYVARGGDESHTVGVRCICNGLISTVGLGDDGEPPIVTLGQDVGFIRYLTREWYDTYSAADAMKYLLRPPLQ